MAWAAGMLENVLPDVPYAPLTFTIPKILRQGFLFDRTRYGDLCRSAYAATRMFFEAQLPGLDRPVPAMVLSPQSWGSLLNPHPHAHALCSLGVFARDGQFHGAGEDIDFSPLSELFRGVLLRTFLKKEKITQERIELIRNWRHSGFHVKVSRRISPGDRAESFRSGSYKIATPRAISPQCPGCRIS